MNYQKIAYFPGLNSLRFLAASLVIFHHGETIREKYNLRSFDHLSFFQNGNNAVNFFFVLSGFLITYLLLKEKGTDNRIDVKSFYLKRIYRIWPLYFLLVIAGVILLPLAFHILHVNYDMPYTFSNSWYYFVLFVPSIVTFKFGHHLLEPLWSIGVEEWFYILWAPLIYISKKPAYAILSVVVVKIGLLYYADANLLDGDLTAHLIHTFAFEAMAIGGIGAFLLYYNRSNFHNKLFCKPVAAVLLGYLIFYLVANKTINHNLYREFCNSIFFKNILLNTLYLYTILYVAMVTPKSRLFNNKILDYLGQISYGIYMYHMIVIFGSIQLFLPWLLRLSTSVCFISFYGFVFMVTILVAHLSKRYFEDFFLRFRKRMVK